MVEQRQYEPKSTTTPESASGSVPLTEDTQFMARIDAFDKGIEDPKELTPLEQLQAEFMQTWKERRKAWQENPEGMTDEKKALDAKLKRLEEQIKTLESQTDDTAAQERKIA